MPRSVLTGGAPLAINVRNDTATAFPAGSLLYVNGWNETLGISTVDLADADVLGKLAQLIIFQPLPASATGVAFQEGRLRGVNTGGATVGDPVYLSTSAGGFTLTAPTTTDSSQQIIGHVAVVSTTAGAIEVNLLVAGSVGPAKVGSIAVQASSVAAGQLATGAVTGAKMATGAIKMTVIAGGAAGNRTVTGIKPGDELASVVNLAASLGGVADLTSEFTISVTNTINNTGGTATTLGFLIVLWISK